MKSITSSTKKTRSLSQSLSWQSSRLSWPQLPGVYWFLGPLSQILYVGKAKNLRNRLNSYTRVKADQPKTHRLVHHATSLKFQISDSEIEALLVESQLIKAHQPPYNSALKDDKTPLYLIITKDKYPRVLTARKKELLTKFKHLSQRQIFGPFNSATDLHRIFAYSRKVFQFCNLHPKKGKACFYYHLGQCSGACLGVITQTDYQKTIRLLKLFLTGKRNSLVKALTKQMKLASKARQFEKAQLAKDQLDSINNLYNNHSLIPTDPVLPVLEEDTNYDMLVKTSYFFHKTGLLPLKYPLSRIEAYDISNTSGHLSTASMVVFINAKPSPSDYRHFKIKFTKGMGDPKMIKETLARRLNHPDWPLPNLIIIDGGKGQLKAALSITEGKIPTASIVKNPDRVLVFHHHQYVFTPLTPGNPTAKLIQQLRDESHRFAKNYHINLRRRALTSHSKLQ